MSALTDPQKAAVSVASSFETTSSASPDIGRKLQYAPLATVYWWFTLGPDWLKRPGSVTVTERLLGLFSNGTAMLPGDASNSVCSHLRSQLVPADAIHDMQRVHSSIRPATDRETHTPCTSM